MSPAAHTWTPHQITLKRHKWPFHNELPLLGAGGIYSCFHATAASLSFKVNIRTVSGPVLWCIPAWWASATMAEHTRPFRADEHWLSGDSLVWTARWNIHATEQGAWNHLKSSEWCCQVIMVTITKRRRHRFWNKICLAIQLTLGCSHQIPSVSTAERLSMQLGQMPVQYLMLLPLSGACSFTDAEADLDASQTICALCRGSRFWMEIGLPRSPYRRVHYGRAIRDFLIHGSLALFRLSVCACVCARRWCYH